MKRHLAALRASGPEGVVQLPGDTAAAEIAHRLEKGIPIGEVLLRQLRDLGARLELEDRFD
jgi:LDH2 family malate/lactate/ureidoglycolate dehydrogenase